MIVRSSKKRSRLDDRARTNCNFGTWVVQPDRIENGEIFYPVLAVFLIDSSQDVSPLSASSHALRA